MRLASGGNALMSRRDAPTHLSGLATPVLYNYKYIPSRRKMFRVAEQAYLDPSVKGRSDSGSLGR
jgi:hypothetical protein